MLPAFTYAIISAVIFLLAGLFALYRFTSSVFSRGAPYVWPALFERRVLPFRHNAGKDAARNVITALGTERIMVISQDGGLFSVLGESGIVYNVRINTQPSCDCPSFLNRFSRGSQSACCKHLGFVLVKVLGVQPNSYILHQVALLSWEVAYWLLHARRNSHLAPKPVLEALGVSKATSREADTRCAICYDDIDGSSSSSSTTRCGGQCRSVFHADCVEQYNASQLPLAPRCAVCRAPWLAESLAVAQVIDRAGIVRQQISHPHGAMKKRRASSVKKKNVAI